MQIPVAMELNPYGVAVKLCCHTLPHKGHALQNWQKSASPTPLPFLILRDAEGAWELSHSLHTFVERPLLRPSAFKFPVCRRELTNTSMGGSQTTESTEPVEYVCSCHTPWPSLESEPEIRNLRGFLFGNPVA